MKHEKAEQLKTEIERTLGSGWVGHVWDNLGWRVCWQNGAVCLHYCEHGNADGFWAMVGDIGSGTGNIELTPRSGEHYIDPLKAVKAAIEYAQEADVERRQIMLSCAGVLLGLGVVRDEEKAVDENYEQGIADEKPEFVEQPAIITQHDEHDGYHLNCTCDSCGPETRRRKQL